MIALLLAMAFCGPTITIPPCMLEFTAQSVLEGYIDITIKSLVDGGWVAVGLGQTMRNADVWFVSIKNGEYQVTARKATGQRLPALDPEQGLSLLNVSQAERTIKFRRPSQALSSANLAFQKGPQPFICAAYSSTSGDEELNFHGTRYKMFSYDVFGTQNVKSDPQGSSAIISNLSIFISLFVIFYYF